MKIIKPYYKILSKIEGSEILKNIERAGRTCYKSEEKISDESAPNFIRMLLKKGHESVLEHQSISVLFVCDRGVSHELVRHRLASFSQESTRYCNYSKDKFDNQLTFILPEWLQSGDPEQIWLKAMHAAEIDYNRLIELGWLPQQARSILPNSLKTEIVITANIREWRTIFKQRCSAAAHPQMRELMQPLFEELSQLLSPLFDDLKPIK